MREYVVAIDLGTSCTAYSWKSMVDPNPVVGVPDMAPNEDIVGKSPTVLLIGGNTGDDQTFRHSHAEAYGRVAERRYAEGDISPGAQLFQRFKMQLHSRPQQQNYDDLLNAVTKSTSKRAEMMLMDIFVVALEFVKDAALRMMTVMRPLTAQDVTWVLTVPVCCSEPAKHFMREAAVKAGFIQGGHDDESLVMCMEPIAACLALGDRLTWKMNDKYLVIDCGGGTVDISSFSVVSTVPARLEQLGEAVGGPWGSTFVDKPFKDFFMNFLNSVACNAGPRSVKSFEASSAMYRIQQAWERAKIGMRTVNDSCRIDLSELSGDPLEVTMEDMDKERRKRNARGEELVGGDGTWDLLLRPALLKKFFDPKCNDIAGEVSKQLQAPLLQGLTSVVMVGGFSGSVHVQEAVKACVLRKYPDHSVQVLVAKSPDLAIVQGAAHFVSGQQTSLPDGHNGGQYPSAPHQYLSVTRPLAVPMFDSTISSNSYGILASEMGGDGTASFFDPFFLKGQGYSMNHMETKNYEIKANSPFVLSVSSSSSPNVKLGANRLNDIGGTGALQSTEFVVHPPPPQGTGSCCLPFRKSSPPTTVVINVDFFMGGIELHVRVRSGNGQVLLQQAVPFLEGERAAREPPLPARASASVGTPFQ